MHAYLKLESSFAKCYFENGFKIAFTNHMWSEAGNITIHCCSGSVQGLVFSSNLIKPNADEVFYLEAFRNIGGWEKLV